MAGFISTERVCVLREKHYELFKKVYDAAKELREDLKVMHDFYADPEKKNIATFSVHDDLEAFMKAMKEANRAVKDTTGKYITRYDDYLRTRGGQYALSKEMLSIMDMASFDAHQAETKKR